MKRQESDIPRGWVELECGTLITRKHLRYYSGLPPGTRWSQPSFVAIGRPHSFSDGCKTIRRIRKGERGYVAVKKPGTPYRFYFYTCQSPYRTISRRYGKEENALAFVSGLRAAGALAVACKPELPGVPFNKSL